MANWQQTYEQLKKRKKEVDKVKSTSEIKQIDKNLSNKRMSVMEYDVSRNELPMFERLPNKNFNTTVKPLSTSSKKEEKERKWFNLGAFNDGYNVGDITKTILGTSKNITQNLYEGVIGIGEKVIDAGAYGVGLLGDKEFKSDMQKFIEKDLVDEEKIAKYASWTNPTALINQLVVGDKTEDYTVLGDKSQSLVQSAGQLAGTMALQGVGVPWWLTTGTTSFGGEVEQGFKKDATYGEAGFSGLVTAGAEILTEKISGGISFGGKTLDEGLTKAISEKITNKTLNKLAKFGIDATGEGLEEVATEFISTIGQQLSYEKEETWNTLLNDEKAMDNYIDQVGEALFGEEARENYTEAFIGGAVLGGVSNVGKSVVETDETRKDKKGTNQQQEDIAPVQKNAQNIENNVQNDAVNNNEMPNTVQSVEDIDNQIAVLEEQLMATENEAEYQRLSNQIQELEQQANQIEQQQEIAPIKAASVEEISQPTTQEVNSNSLVEVESNTQINPENQLSEGLVREIQYKTAKANENKANVQMLSTNEITTNEKNGGYRTQEQVNNLREDIKNNGITTPIEVKRNNDGSIEVVNGNHRLSIAKEIGLKEIPVKYVNDKLGNIDNSRNILYNNDNEKSLDYIEGEFESGNRNGNDINERNVRSEVDKENSSNNNVALENEGTTRKNDKVLDKVQGDNDGPPSTSTHGQNTRIKGLNKTTPTQEELDNLEYTRKNKSGSKYASAFYDLEKKYGSANLYKGLNNYKSTGKALVEDVAPIKAELTDLTKELKSTIKDTKKELKALKTELNEVKEDISNVVEEYKSITEAELPGYEQQGRDSIRSIPDSEIDNMVAPVREDTTPEYEFENDNEGTPIEVKSPLEDRTLEEVGSRKVKAYQYEHPEVRPYFQKMAGYMLNDLNDSVKGERIMLGGSQTDGYYEFTGTKRQTTDDIAALLDSKYNYSYADIRKGLEAIIEDHGAENIAVAKRIEFALDERLRNGYTDALGYEIPANEDYIKLLETNEWNDYLSSIQDDDIAPYEAITEPITNETTQDNVIAPVIENVVEKPVNQSLAIEQAPTQEEFDNGGPMLKVSPEMETKTIKPQENVETPTLEGNKNLSVKESNALKLKNLEISLKQYNYDAEQSLNSFNELIAEKKRQYNALKNKNTQKANNVLQQINRITAQRDNTQIEYERKMNNLEKRIDKMNSVDFKRAEQRMTKQEEYRKQANDLIGDTSTWTDKKLGIQYQINTFKRNLRDIVKGVDGKADIQRADAIYNEYQGKYDTNEAALKEEFNRLAEPFRNRKLTRQEEVYTQMLGELKHNPGTTLKQDMVDSYYNKYKNKIDVDKVNQTIDDARKLYDELFERINDRLRRQGMKELEYRRGYFPHFTEEKQSMLAKLFDWKVKNDQIPTDIAGLTELNNPERSWQSFNKHREGDTTDYNFSKGFDTYVHGALDWIYHIEDIQKRRALENEIRYQHSEEGVKKKIEEIYSNPDLDVDEVQTQIEAVYGVAKNPLNNFVTDLRNSTNNLAGKKSTLDRSLEYATNRQIYSTVTNLSNRVSGNMIGGSISSALTNFIPITQSWSQVSPVSSLKALGETIKSSVKDDGTIAKSTFLTNRLVKADNLYKSNWDKAADKVAIMTDAIDSITSQVVWRAKYNENIKAGMSEFEAIKDADQFAEGVIAGRSRGNEPTLFNSKNPITKMFTAFQLEVNNQYHYMFKDMPTDIGSKSKAKLIKGYATMFLGAYAYNALYSSLVGRDVAFDPIGLLEGILKELGIGGDDEEENEKTASEKFTAITEDLVQQVPFVGGLFGGGRVPISAAIPYENPIEMVKGTATDLLDALDEEKREKSLKNLTSEWLKPVTYLALPFGGGQINKTYQGLSMYDDELPIAGSYTNSGDLRFTADESTWGKVQAGLFGRWASDSAQEYVDSGFKTVKKDNLDEMLDLDMTSTEYRKYRTGLSKAIKKAKDNDSLTQTQAAADYIEGLDVSDSQKAIMLENYFKSNLDEEAEKELDALNMTADAKFSYFTAKSKIGSLENDYKNNIESLKKKYGEDSDEYEEKAGILAKEKQEKVINEVLNSSLNDEEKKYLYSKYYSSEKALNEITDTGTSMDTYLNFVKDTMYFTADLDEDGKTISGSLNNKYSRYLLDSNLADEEKTALYEYGVLSGYDSEDKYKDYKTLKAAGVDINSWLDFDSQEFEADYKSNGKVISGSKKNKVISYVNSLDLSIPQKAMIIRTKYTSFDDYNNDIVDYVVDLNIDYEEKVFMIETLGMKVSEDGTVRW